MTMNGGPDYLLTLEIGSITARDAGAYRCVATTKRGEATCNINLIFDGRYDYKLSLSENSCALLVYALLLGCNKTKYFRDI